MEKSIKIFKALGDETRVKILNLISNKTMCAKGIAKHLNISEAAVSQQIKILKEAELIVGYKIGYHVNYDLNEVKLRNSIKFIESIIDNDKTNIYNINDIECDDKKYVSQNEFREESVMKICFPVKSNEGLKSMPYGHFGSAPLFLVSDLDSNEVSIINNGDLEHEHGKCQPIKALSGHVVDAVVVGGIGAGAIKKLGSMGIKVYKAVDGDVSKNIEAFKNNELKEFPSNHVCNHDGCGHH